MEDKRNAEDKNSVEDKSSVKDKSNKEEGNKVCNKELDRYERIVDRAHKEIAGVRYVYMCLVGVLGFIIAGGIGLLTYSNYSTIGEMESNLEKRVGKLEKRVEERIEEQFDRENIRKTVEDKAKERIDAIADKLIGERINEKAADSEKRLGALEEETEKNLKAMQTRSEFLLTVLRAQNGDKESWFKLIQIAEKEQETELGRFASIAAARVYDDFFKIGLRRGTYYKPIVSNSEVVEKLKHDWPLQRKTAVYTIKERSMYDQIPVLISMILREDDLGVLSEIYSVLNKLLGTDIRITIAELDKDALKFEEAWKAKKKQLEETKGDKK